MTDLQTKRVGAGSYIIAVLGLIPVIGVLFAIITVVLGLSKRAYGGKTLIVLGGIGMILSAGAVLALMSFQKYVSVIRQENRISKELSQGQRGAASMDAARLKNDLGK